MIPFVEHWIGFAWLAFVVLWFVAGISSKRSVRTQTGSSRLFQAGLIFIGVMIFNLNHWFVSGWPSTRIIPSEAAFILGGAIITVAGMLFCAWARVILGTNWSSAVTVKQNHELVRRGPYQIVRHPIFTGFSDRPIRHGLRVRIHRMLRGGPANRLRVLAEVPDRRAVHGAAIRRAVSAIQTASARVDPLHSVTETVTSAPHAPHADAAADKHSSRVPAALRCRRPLHGQPQSL